MKRWSPGPKCSPRSSSNKVVRCASACSGVDLVVDVSDLALGVLGPLGPLIGLVFLLLAAACVFRQGFDIVLVPALLSIVSKLSIIGICWDSPSAGIDRHSWDGCQEHRSWAERK